MLLYTHRRDTIGISTTSGSFFPLSKASVLSYQRALRKDWSIWKLGELYDHKVGFWWQLHSHISQCTGFLYLDPKWLSSHDQNTQIKWQYSKCMMWFTLRYRTNNGLQNKGSFTKWKWWFQENYVMISLSTINTYGRELWIHRCGFGRAEVRHHPQIHKHQMIYQCANYVLK